MAVDFASLAIIALVAAVCPVVAQRIPGKPVPETVLLLVAGALVGPHMAGWVHLNDAITLLSDLGLGFLFLLAGYEIDPKSLSGAQGKAALVTWVATLVLAFAVSTAVVPLHPNLATGPHGVVAVALVLTTTALGTLMPILKERGLLGTRVGELVVTHGTWGELGPVLAMAVLMSTRKPWQTAVVLALLALLCVIIGRHGRRAQQAGTVVYRILVDRADSTNQTLVRTTVLILVTLVTFSAAFNLDIVLGSFAAGFVLRYLIPEGYKQLETKLEGMGYGFFIPLFFVVSGAKIDLAALGAAPQLLVAFIVALLAVRAVPVFISLRWGRTTRSLPLRQQLCVAFYSTTALPLIVAVTGVAVESELMTQTVASVLVAAGAVTVFLMPLLANIAYKPTPTNEHMHQQKS